MNKLKSALLRSFWAMLPACREVVVLVSRDRDGELNFLQRLRMKVHLRFCAFCARYVRQIEMIASDIKEEREDPGARAPREVLDRLKDNFRRRSQAR